MRSKHPRHERVGFRRRCAACACAALSLVAASFAAGDGGAPTLDDLLEIAPDAPMRRRAPDAAPEDRLIDALRQAPPDDLTATLLKDMEAASDQLGEHGNTGLVTQRHQEAALAKLDALIEAAKKNRSKGKGSGKGGKPQKRLSGSAENAARKEVSAGTASGNSANEGAFSPGSARREEGDAMPQRDASEQWGNLPPRIRSELIQARRERFSALYRGLTEDYYRTLAEEDDR